MAFNDTRKRSREDDTYCDSSMPLSKRINNLHLTNYEETLAIHTQFGPHSSQYMIAQNPQQIMGELQCVYNPCIKQSDNPYYLQNKMLFYCHMERLKRGADTCF